MHKNDENLWVAYSRWPDEKTRLDLLISEDKYFGKGLAAHMIKQFLSDHYQDADIIFIDPEFSNTKAIHVYEKVGFKKIETFIASWHPVPHDLMILKK